MQRHTAAIIRGPWLNPFEMQTYELLKPKFDIMAFASTTHDFDTTSIDLPIRFLHQPLELGCGISKWQGFCDRLARWYVGSEHRLLGLEGALRGFDIVHTVETYHYFSGQVLSTQRRYGTIVVVTVWENIPFREETKPNIKATKEAVRQSANLFLAVTHQAKLALCLEGVPEDRIRVVGAGIDTQRFCPAPPDFQLRESLGLSNGTYVILFAGSLLWAKGVYDLVFAVDLLRRDRSLRDVSFKLLMVGQGPELSQLRRLIRELNLGDLVHLVGAVPYHDMPQMHQLADVFVLPSIPTTTWQEQFGMVLAESMACGKAVIGTHSGAIPEIVGEAGVLVSPACPAELADRLKSLLLDDAERLSLGAQARRRVEQLYDRHRVADQISQAYYSVLSTQTACGIHRQHSL